MDEKVSEDEFPLGSGHYFSILRGVYFLTFFNRVETERDGLFPLFSHEPHAKQDHMGGPQMAISVFFPWPSVQAISYEQVTLSCLFKLLTILVSVSCTLQFKELIICTYDCTVLYTLALAHFSTLTNEKLAMWKIVHLENFCACEILPSSRKIKNPKYSEIFQPMI